MKWAHLLCAMWIPEVSLGNVTFQEPVQDVEKVPKTRWKLVSPCLTYCLAFADQNCSLATSVSRRWERAFSAATSRASRPSMLPAHAKRAYACE